MSGESQNSLKASGISYLIGDAALIASGLIEGDKKTARAGLFWGMGGVTMALYGNPKAEKRLRMLEQDLARYLQEEGIVIPKGNALTNETLNSPRGVIDGVERFLYRHPSQVLNALYAVGSAELMHSGWKASRPWKTAAGAMVMGGALAGLLIPEVRDDGADRHGGSMVQRAWSWVQEKPLRLSGLLYTGNNVAMTVDAFHQKKSRPAAAAQLLMVASYLVGNFFLASSSKDNVSSGESEEAKTLRELERVAAGVIAAQPREVRDLMVGQVAGYLSGQPGVNVSAADIADGIHKAIGSQTESIAPGRWQAHVAQSSAEPSPHL